MTGFTRRIEDFECANCHALVQGDGYTNHCPRCLWSKHVDVDPGDRAESCGGMMRPVKIEGASPEYVIVHACESCRAVSRVRAGKDDDTDALLRIAGNP
jgi:hypothetical protein